MTVSYHPLSGNPERVGAINGSLLVREQTSGFFNKKQFRAYYEFAATTVLRFTAARPFLLTHQSLWTGQGSARMVISTGGTPGGTFTPVATKFCKYLLDGAVDGDTTLAAGGTVTIGQEREVLRSDSSTAGGGSGNSNTLGGERALPAGTYYMTITVTGTTAGMYSLEWEEL